MTQAEGVSKESLYRESTHALAMALARADSSHAAGRATAMAVARALGDLCIVHCPPTVLVEHPDAATAALAEKAVQGDIESRLLAQPRQHVERIRQPNRAAAKRLLGEPFAALVDAMGVASLLVFPLDTVPSAQQPAAAGALLVMRGAGGDAHDPAEESVLGTWALLLAGRLQVLSQNAQLKKYRERETGPGVHALEAEVASRGRALRRSNRDLAQFASVVSHDLKQPLRTVSLYSERLQTLLAEPLAASTQAREALAFVRRAADDGRELVEDLLHFSRVTGDVAMSFSPVSMDEIVAGELAGPLGAEIAASGASVTVHPLPVVGGSQVRLAQLMRNLISNALKFSGDTAPEIEISAAALDSDHEITVADRGIGVPATQHEAIFEVFHRLHTRDEIRGTGVGLALCRSIAELHEGSIRAEDNPGGGTRFILTLPRRTA